jgi:hypothetical protein
MTNTGYAPDRQRELPLSLAGGETGVGETGQAAPVNDEGLMERIVARDNRRAALRQVRLPYRLATLRHWECRGWLISPQG